MGAPSDEHETGPARRSTGGWAVAIALVSALVGAGAGIGGTALGARLSASSSSEQAKADYLRQQRQVVYSEFLVDAGNDYDKTFSALQNYTQGNTSPSIASFQAMLEAKGTLSQTFAQLEIVGSTPAVQVARKYSAASRVSFRSLRTLQGNETLFANRVNTLYASLHALRPALVAAARHDVGN